MTFHMSREWAMPSHRTFDIKPIGRFIKRHIRSISVDPFANLSNLADIRNDPDPECGQPHCTTALDFLSNLPSASASTVLFDPPYSNRQISECYKRLDQSVDMTTTQANHWESVRNQMGRILRPGGIILSFGWSSSQMGKKRGFDMIEILLVAHGGSHYDTICTAERKRETLFDLFS